MIKPPHQILLIIILFHILFIALGNTDKEYQIDNRIILQEGLSQSRIQTILEDSRGFMWFGTADGLNRYDGYKIKIFRNIVSDSTSLPNNYISALIEDSIGNIWIGTRNGIIKFDPYTEIFKSYKDEDSVRISLGANNITSSAIDNHNNLWFGTNGYGIIKLNPDNNSNEYFFSERNNKFNSISNLYIDSKNRLWIGNFIETKISYFDIENQKIVSLNINDLNNKKSNTNKVQAVYEDLENRIWISVIDYYSGQGSLFYMNSGTDNFLNYNDIFSKEIKYSYWDTFNAITSIKGDSHGNIWFSSKISGVFKLRFGQDPIAYYVDSPITDSRINCIYISKKDILWIGTNGNGIEISTPQKALFKILSSKSTPGFDVESIRCILEDDLYYWIGGYYGVSKVSKSTKRAQTLDKASMYSIAVNLNNKDVLWTGTEGGSVKIMNKENGELTDIELNPSDTNKKYIEDVYCMIQLSDTLLLIGTSTGLYGYNPINKTTIPFPYSFLDNTAGRYQVAVRSINFHNDDILITYTQGGIGVLNLKERVVLPFKLTSNTNLFVDYNPINSIYFDDQSNLWIATTTGLISINNKTFEAHHFTEADGLPNSHLYGILPDENGNIWMSTNNGLSCYNPVTGIFSNFDVSDGIQNNEFNTGAFLKSRNGDLFFGGISGVTYFNPEIIEQNEIIPKIEITGIRFENIYQQLSKDDIDNRTFTIPHNVELFTIEFAGLSFINSFKNEYKYRIREISDQWIDLENEHYISFNNLSNGKYTLEILACNNHGFWIQKPFVCTIKIIPKFYESNIFRWLMTFILFLAILIFIRLRLKRITSQKNKLQVLVDEQTSQLRETNNILREEVSKHSETTKELLKTIKTKDKFLSIIAHDIIGPLGVIQGFSDLLIENKLGFTESERNSFHKTINITVKQLSALLSNLLQWSRLQSKSITPAIGKVSILETTNEVVSLLGGNLDDKKIKLIVNIDKESYGFADKNMLQTILRNLISNAIKFTNDGGIITLNSTQHNEYIEISINDTGKGMSHEEIENILNSDINFTTKGTKNESGTGLGLNLVNEFIIMNGGKLRVDSKLNSGSTFYFTLPSKPIGYDKV